MLYSSFFFAFLFIARFIYQFLVNLLAAAAAAKMVEDDWEDVFLRIFTRTLYFLMAVIHDFVKYFNKFEASIDKILIKAKPYLPDVARFCIVSTFIEDGFRKWMQWDAHRGFIEETWNCGWYSSTLFVFYQVFGQLIPAIVILSRKYVTAPCFIFINILYLQIVVYNVSYYSKFITSNFSVLESLFLLYDITGGGEISFLAFNSQRNNDDHQLNPWMRLVGRVWLRLMYFCLEGYCLRFSSKTLFTVTFVLFIPLYFKCKSRLFTMMVVLWIFGLNLWFNSWWMVPTDYFYRDFMKLYFFRAISVIGGLLLFLAYGPGGICLDVDGNRIIE